jgi:hypothetical protein
MNMPSHEKVTPDMKKYFLNSKEDKCAAFDNQVFAVYGSRFGVQS